MSDIIIEQIENFALSAKSKPEILFSEVGVIGCGTSGQNIALMIASRGIEITFIEVNQEKIDEATRQMSEQLDEKIDNWGMTSSEKKLILSRIKGSLDYNDLAKCDIVIESIKTRENGLQTRKNVFKQIEEVVSEKAIIATDSTTTLITELASDLKHKERCISLHFLTANKEANIVEFAKGLYSSDEVTANVMKFAKLINKVPVSVEESSGLVSVRLDVALIGEACEILMERVASIENIDKIMKKGMGLPLGPFEMADRIGLDRVVCWMDNLYSEFGDIKYKAPPVLKKLVRAKHLGLETREGFYKYDEYGRKLKGQSKLSIDCSSKN